MRRKKVKLAYITNDSATKATFKRRKKGLIKKVNELSILCDVDACAIICSLYDAQPEVYPSSLGVHRVLAKFKRLPDMEQSKKMVNQESFLRQGIAKANEQLNKLRKENREKEIAQLMFQSLTGVKGLQGLTVRNLNDLGWLIEQNLKDINKRMERMKDKPTQDYKPRAVAVQPTIAMEGKPRSGGESNASAPAAVERPPRGGETNMDTMQRQLQWFVDLINSQEQQQVALGGEEVMLPFRENDHWTRGVFP